MRRWSRPLLAVAIIAGSVALATLLVSLAPKPESRGLPPQLPFALTGAVAAGDPAVPVYGSGTVRPSAEVDIAAQVGGKVVWVDPGFQRGRRVKAGQLLFRIEEADYRHGLEIATAELDASRVAVLEAEQEASIATTEYALFTERQELAGQAPPSPLTLRKPQLRAARAALARAEARLAEAQLALDRTRVAAPFDGFVRQAELAAGQILAPGQTVGRLFAADAVEVVVPLSDADAALIPGLREFQSRDAERQVAARVTARFGDGVYAWAGRVDRVAAALDEQTRMIDVIVRVPDPFSPGNPLSGASAAAGAPPLLVGAFVDVELEGVAAVEHFRVPRAALQPGNQVWTVGAGGRIGIVEVRVLQRGDDEAIVAGALQAGETVVTGGLQFAIEGMRVLTEADGPQ